ncbi:MAG: MBL fold metallo-hydrolase [Streptosporangiales bacterium]|nr:MBL fold metallo-hydrolase [Streptosporangiales bacterium]
MTDQVTVTFAGSGDAFGSGGRFQACIHVRPPDGPPVLLDCGASSLVALKRLALDPSEIAAVVVSHLHGDHFGGLPFLILDGQFAKRTEPLTVVGPPGTGARLMQAMEVMYPGSSEVRRAFDVDVLEVTPGSSVSAAGVHVAAWEVAHPSGAPALAVRLDVAGRSVAYTGDTSWTDALVAAADGVDLLIAECYYLDKPIPHHLTHAALREHRDRLRAARTVVTHLSTDVLDRQDQVDHEVAHDGFTVRL